MGKDLDDFLDLLQDDGAFRRDVMAADSEEALVLLASEKGLTLMRHEALAVQSAMKKYLMKKHILSDSDLHGISAGRSVDIWQIRQSIDQLLHK